MKLNILKGLLRGRAVLLNAPPDTGKDFAARHLGAATGASHREFKATLHNIAMAITGLPKAVYFSIYNDRKLKEAPHPLFLGLSPRAMLIWISEDVCKPKFGKSYFGKPAAAALDLINGSVFSDSGFPIEVFPLADRIGGENIFVVQFTRHGKTFEGDSRNYLKPEDCPDGVHFITLENNKDIIEFTNEITEWIGGIS